MKWQPPCVDCTLPQLSAIVSKTRSCRTIGFIYGFFSVFSTSLSGGSRFWSVESILTYVPRFTGVRNFKLGFAPVFRVAVFYLRVTELRAIRNGPQSIGYANSLNLNAVDYGLDCEACTPWMVVAVPAVQLALVGVVPVASNPPASIPFRLMK